jgi:hypothetical protein
MAKIHEEIVVIKFSKLVRESDTANTIANDELVTSLGAVAEELAGTGVIVEVESAK